MQLLHLQKTCMAQETVNETQSVPFSCYLILATLPYLTVTVCCCHLRVPLSLLCTRTVSNLKKVQQRQTYADGGLHKVTQGSEWTATLSLTHSRSHVLPPHCCRRHDHTRFFYDFISFFMFTGNDHFPCRTWPGTVPHITTAFVHTSQCDNRLDNTTRLSHGKVHETTANHARCTHRHC